LWNPQKVVQAFPSTIKYALVIAELIRWLGLNRGVGEIALRGLVLALVALAILLYYEHLKAE
jgi:hypothetical protein